jgi:hypothetical protein
MDVNEVLVEAYDRVPGLIDAAVGGLTPQQLRWAPVPGANPIGWIVWHLARVQDHHLSEVLGSEQLWVTAGWARRFGRDPDPADTGYGHSPEQVAALDPGDAGTLTGYLGAVTDRTRAYLATLRPGDLDRVVDDRWDPPVTLGVRLVSVVDDDVQHAGQAGYLRGLLDGRPADPSS